MMNLCLGGGSLETEISVVDAVISVPGFVVDSLAFTLVVGLTVIVGFTLFVGFTMVVVFIAIWEHANVIGSYL